MSFWLYLVEYFRFLDFIMSESESQAEDTASSEEEDTGMIAGFDGYGVDPYRSAVLILYALISGQQQIVLYIAKPQICGVVIVI